MNYTFQNKEILFESKFSLSFDKETVIYISFDIFRKIVLLQPATYIGVHAVEEKHFMC